VPRLLLWAIPGVITWVATFVAASYWLTGERGDQARYGLVPLVLLLWYVPDALFGLSGALEVESLFLVVGFPLAAAYLVILMLFRDCGAAENEN
jgi:hypothetical protein